MAIEFFDNIANSVSQVAREASDKMKSSGDKRRVRKDITAMENELRSLFQSIGQQYYDTTAANPDPEYADLFSEIQRLKDALAAKQRELDAIDGNTTCPNCGKQLSKDARFCSSCGTQLPEPAPAPAPVEEKRPTVCPNCGSTLAADAMFCAICGTKVNAADAPAEAPKKNICPNCGEVLPSDALFCAVCGTKAPDID